MRRLLLVLTLVASSFGLTGVAREAEAVECRFCELAGATEGSGIIFPDPFYGHQMYWEGRFNGALVGAGGPLDQPVTVSEHEYNFFAWGTLQELNHGVPIPEETLPEGTLPEGTLLEGAFQINLYETWDTNYAFPVYEFWGTVRGTADLSNTGVIPSSWTFTRVGSKQASVMTYSQLSNLDSRFRGVASFSDLF